MFVINNILTLESIAPLNVNGMINYILRKRKMNKFKLVFVPYSLGKFYIYRIGGKRHDIIEMNRNMYDYSQKLFFWVLQHELMHFEHYQQPGTEGIPDTETEEVQKEKRKINRRMKQELFVFQLKYPMETVIPYFLPTLKRFSIKENVQLLTSDKTIHYHDCTPLPEEEELKVKNYVEGL